MILLHAATVRRHESYVIVRIYVSGNVIRRARLLEWIQPLLKVEFEPCAVEENNGRVKPVKQNSFDCVVGS